MTLATLILPTFVVEFGQWVCHSLIITLAVAEHIDGQVEGLTEGVFVGLALSCDVIGRTVVGTGTHDGKSCRIVHPVVHGQELEGSQSLVVVHGQHGIIVLKGSTAEEAVGGIGAVGIDAFLIGLLDGRREDGLFLFSQESVVACMGVESQHGNAGTGDKEVTAQGSMEDAELLQDAFGGEAAGYLRHGQVGRCQCHTYALVH